MGGRAGRFGTKGLGISFVSTAEEQTVLDQIQERFEVRSSPCQMRLTPPRTWPSKPGARCKDCKDSRGVPSPSEIFPSPGLPGADKLGAPCTGNRRCEGST